ncbi:hypothetical protein OPQ81_010649 [Rhizoctonia solani]|nr:hypothetical protein OPQ81_010649 [Rhizoctonia solani]
MEDSNTPRRALPFKALFKTLFPGSLVPKLDSKATIIVWAAATEGSPAYPEADLPGRVGENDIMVGAICRALESATGAVPRKILFGKIQEAVVEYNAAREAKYGSRTEAEQNDARIAGKYCGPQLACLLSSHGNRELVLDSPAFEAIWGD